MQSDLTGTAPVGTTGPGTAPRPSLLRAVRHHPLVVVLLLALGILGGYLLATSQPVSYTSSAHVLVNPTVGNPFAPAPSSVRQDELTSLETEAQVARSAEVLSEVAAKNPPLTLREVQRRSTIDLPPNTQVLELSYRAADPEEAQQAADSWAVAYLGNRDRRAEEVNAERIGRVEAQTVTVVDDLRAATAAAQKGSTAERLFQSELARALRNELVSLRAQRSYLENSESPAGSVISPASSGTRTNTLTPLLMLVGGFLAGLVLGCVAAMARERSTGSVRSASDVEAAGLPVLAAVPARAWGDRLRRRSSREAVDATMRRLRARVLDLEQPTEIVAVAPLGTGGADAGVSEAVAESFAKAGHRVVLVRADSPSAAHGLEGEQRGLGDALVHERLNVLDLLQPSVDPLLCLLPWGSDVQSRELLEAGRLRTALMPLVDAGHLVVVQSPGLDSAAGEAVVGAADLGLVVVTTGRTRLRDLARSSMRTGGPSTTLAALVVDRHTPAAHQRPAHGPDAPESDVDSDASVARDPAARGPR